MLFSVHAVVALLLWSLPSRSLAQQSGRAVCSVLRRTSTQVRSGCVPFYPCNNAGGCVLGEDIGGDPGVVTGCQGSQTAAFTSGSISFFCDCSSLALSGPNGVAGCAGARASASTGLTPTQAGSRVYRLARRSNTAQARTSRQPQLSISVTRRARRTNAASRTSPAPTRAVARAPSARSSRAALHPAMRQSQTPRALRLTATRATAPAGCCSLQPGVVRAGTYAHSLTHRAARNSTLALAEAVATTTASAARTSATVLGSVSSVNGGSSGAATPRLGEGVAQSRSPYWPWLLALCYAMLRL